MSSIYAALSAKDQKVRKQWLIALLVFSAPYLLAILAVLGMGAYGYFSGDSSLNNLVFYAIVGFLALSLLGVYIPYRCAYKSPGLILLTIYLIFVPLMVLMNVYRLWRNGFDIIPFVFFLFGTAISAWWYILSFKLRKINKNLRAQRHAPKEYTKALTLMKEAQTLEDLNRHFSHLVREWPQYEPTSSLAHQEATKTLHKNNPERS